MSKQPKSKKNKPKKELAVEAAEIDLAARVAQLESDNVRLESKLNESTAKPKRSFSWRTVGVFVLVLVGALSLSTANVSSWADRTTTDNATYVKTVTPVISDPAVQKAIQTYAFDQLTANVDYDKLVKDALPEQASILAAPLAGQLKNYSNQLIGEIVKSKQFATVWVSVNDTVHKQLIQIVSDYKGNGKIDVSQIYAYISKQLETTPLKVLANQKLPDNVANIQVLDASGLKTAHQALSTLHEVRIWSWVIAFFAFVGAILLARRRMFTVMWIGISTIIVAAVTLISYQGSQVYAISQIADPVYKDAALAAWTILLRDLYAQTVALLVLGFALAIGAWLAAGRGAIARFRPYVANLFSKLSRRIWATPEKSGFVKFLTSYRILIESAIAVLALVVIFLLSPLNTTVVVVASVIVLLLILILEFIVSANIQPTVAVSEK